MHNRLGGLARRATWNETLAADGVPTLQLDAGDLWQAEYTIGEAKAKEVDSTADVYLKTYKALGVKGVAIGDRDLALGMTKLQALAKRAPFALLSVNVLDADMKPVFQPSMTVTLAGTRIGVIGATTALFFNKEQVQTAEKITVSEAAPLVAAEAKRLAADGVKVLVLLAHLNPTEIDACLDAAPEIQFVLGGQWLEFDQTLRMHGKTLIAGAFQRGKNMSVLDVTVKDGSYVFIDRDARAALESKKRDLEAQILGRQKMIESAQKNKGEAESAKFLEQNLVQLKTDLQETTLDLEDLAAPDPKSSFVKWHMGAMDSTLADQADVQKWVEKHRETYPDPTKPKPAPAGPGARAPQAPPAPPAPH